MMAILVCMIPTRLRLSITIGYNWRNKINYNDPMCLLFSLTRLGKAIRLSIYGYASIMERLNKVYTSSSQEKSTNQKPSLVLIPFHIHYSLNVAVEVGKP